MANIINRQQTFSTNGTVTAAGLHNLIDTALVNSAIIKNQQEITTIGTADLLLIAPDSVDASLAPRKVTVQNLLDDGLTAGTFTSFNLTGALTYGTATGNNTISTTATISTATITRLTAGTTTSTAATITNGTITTGLIPTLTAGTTTGTAGIFTSGTIATLNSTAGTIGTLNSTTGTIGNLSTTLAGDFTISQGTATLATSGATAGTYGSVTAIPFITVDAKGRITSATTGTFSSTPADGSITFAKLSTSSTEADNVAKRTAKAWVNFNGTANSSLTGTYSQSGTAITVTITSHGLAVGQIASLTFQTGTASAQSLAVTTVTSSSVFVVTSLTSLTTSGDCTLVKNTIRSSFNVSSIMDNGIGDYTVNFTTAFADSNYAATIGFEQVDAVSSNMSAGIKTMSTSAVRIKCERSSGGDEDLNFICLSAFST